MGGAEPLPRLLDGAESNFGMNRAVLHDRRVQADVAVAARLRILAEIGQQRPPVALGRLAVSDQGIKPLMFAPLVVVVPLVVLDKDAALANIVQAIQHEGVGGLAIASGAAQFLVIFLHIAGQVGVKDVAHVGFVDAHAKGDGGHHDDARLGHEGLLVGGPLGAVESRVVGQRAETVFHQQLRRRFRFLARQAVNDAAVCGPPPDEIQKPTLPLAPRFHGQVDIRPVEAGDEGAPLAVEELRRDVHARRLVGGGRERR